MKDGLNELNEEQILFINAEFNIDKETLFSMNDRDLYDEVYNQCCIIEEIETVESLDNPDEELSDRGRIASEIVTILGNAMSEAEGWMNEADYDEK